MIKRSEIQSVSGRRNRRNFLDSLLFGFSPSSPLLYAGLAALVTMIGWLACYFPARRATRADPITALRSQ